MKFFAQSDKGQERKVNQDSYGYYLAESGLGFFIFTPDHLFEKNQFFFGLYP